MTRTFLSVRILAPVALGGALLSASAWGQSECWQSCPPGALSSAEACGQHTDDGCDGKPHFFAPIMLGDTRCATLGAVGEVEDADWYQVRLAQQTQLMIFSASETPLVFGLARFEGLPGDCDGITAFAPQVELLSCESGVGFACVPAGTWWIAVRPAFAGGAACGGGGDAYWLALLGGAPGDISLALDSLAATRAHHQAEISELEAAIAGLTAGSAILADARSFAAQGRQHALQAVQQAQACGAAAQPALLHLTAAADAAALAIGLCDDMEQQNGLAGSNGLGATIQANACLALYDLIEAQLNAHEYWRAASKGYDAKVQDDRAEDKLDEAKALRTRYDQKHDAAAAAASAALTEIFQAQSSLSVLGPCANSALQSCGQAAQQLQACIGRLNDTAAETLAWQHMRAGAEALTLGQMRITHVVGVIRGCVCPECGVCTGDLNFDNQVDGADLGLLLGGWNGTAQDLDGDGTTDGADLGLLLGAWGACP